MSQNLTQCDWRCPESIQAEHGVGAKPDTSGRGVCFTYPPDAFDSTTAAKWQGHLARLQQMKLQSVTGKRCRVELALVEVAGLVR
jgi:hypothetical protein